MRFSLTKPIAALSVAALLTMASQANAGLIKRTDNLIYDDVSDMTWVADAGLSDKLNWADGTTWADQLSIDGFSDFSLPTLAAGLALVAQDLSLFDVSDIGTSQLWTSTENANNTAKAFWFRLDGSSGNILKTSSNKFSWAVSAGDIAGGPTIPTVSEPATWGIFSLAFAGFAYRRKQLNSKK